MPKIYSNQLNIAKDLLEIVDECFGGIMDIPTAEDKNKLMTNLVTYISAHDTKVWNDGFEKGKKSNDLQSN